MTTRDMNRFFDICRSTTSNSPSHRSPQQPGDASAGDQQHVEPHPLHQFRRGHGARFSACLRRALPTLDGTQSGWGIDWLWPRIVAKPDTAIAIVDDVVIRHTRPLGDRTTTPCAPRDCRPPGVGDVPQDQGIEKNRIEIHRVLWRSGRVEDVRGRSLSFATKFGLGYLHA
jgi:hypothetical protein